MRDRLGLEWGPVVKGAAELDALPADVLAVFSRRRAQVQAAIDAREAEIGRPLTRAERSQWGAIATRDRMQYGIETHTWREEIAARAAEHGLDRELVECVIACGVQRLASGEIPDDGALEHAGEPVIESELGQALTGASGLTTRTRSIGGALCPSSPRPRGRARETTPCASSATGSPAATTSSRRPAAR